MQIDQIRILNILEEMGQNGHISQREMAKKFGISLGLVNAYLKELSKKCQIAITDGAKNRVKYTLTPDGRAEKMRLTYNYIQFALDHYKIVCSKISVAFQELSDKKIRKVLFYGAGEFAQLAHNLIEKTNLKLVGVIDPCRSGTKFMELEVMHPENISSLDYDIVFITELIRRQDLNQIARSINIKLSKCATI